MYDSHPYNTIRRLNGVASPPPSTDDKSSPAEAEGSASQLAVWAYTALIAVSDRFEEDERFSELQIRVTRQIDKLRKERETARAKIKEP